ncbi:MAG: HAD family hydrolase [Prolixibacteraceae bacterium]|jgi:phosphoglycolate phosphatase-like HAD superfamily hydrolase|nr:HAD family hydrolase [Prolixibacteraceae bacterium]
MIKAVIFDFDGVLVESLDVKTEAFSVLFEQEGDDVVRQIKEYHLNNGGVSRFDKFRYIYSNILKKDLDDKTFNNLCSRFSVMVKEKVVSAPYVVGAREFLDLYSKEYLCFVVSATPIDELKDIICKRLMDGYFKEIYGAPWQKKDAIEGVTKGYNLKNHEVIFIGDALNDYEAAKSSSVNFLARCSGRHSFFESLNCIKIKDLSNLHIILKEKFC